MTAHGPTFNQSTDAPSARAAKKRQQHAIAVLAERRALFIAHEQERLREQARARREGRG